VAATFDNRDALLTTRILGNDCVSCANAIPNFCFQMLLSAAPMLSALRFLSRQTSSLNLSAKRMPRASTFFRIFDSLNSIENMRVFDRRCAGNRCGPAKPPFANTGDILDKGRPKYSLKYYGRDGQATGKKLGHSFPGDKKTWPDFANLYATFEIGQGPS